MSGVLDAILAEKRAAIAELRRQPVPAPAPPPEASGAPAPTAAPVPALRPLPFPRPPGGPLRLIAEHKRRSPSGGAFSGALDLEARVRCYQDAGAAMVSVLTDAAFFGGSFADLRRARAATTLPLLCKDFVLDPVQLDHARAAGADAVLLIVRCLDDATLRRLVGAARDRALEPFVEATTEAEAARALDAGARVVGVNARDLDTLRVDRERAARVLGALPPGVVALHFSGLGTPEDVRAVAAGRADGALLGEALMRQDDPTALLRSLVAAT